MPTLLHLDSSADLVTSTSRALTGRFADAWAACGDDHLVVRRDLHTEPLPHLESSGLHWAPHLRGPGEVVSPRAETRQRRLVAELDAADVVVIGAPMYNWSVPSTLKAWLDHVHVGGLTAHFDDTVPPFAGKPVVVVTSCGARYGPGTENPEADHEVPALRQVLGVSMGMLVEVVVAELTLAARVPAMAPLRADADASLEAARARVDDLVRRHARPGP